MLSLIHLATRIQQAHFRLLLEAMARPGLVQPLIALPEKGHPALTILATLLDAEVSLADPDKLLQDDDWPMLQVKSLTQNKLTT